MKDNPNNHQKMRVLKPVAAEFNHWKSEALQGLTESLVYLDMQPEQMRTKTRVSQSVSSETSCEPHTGNTEHYI